MPAFTLQTLRVCLLCTVPTKHSLSGPSKHQPNHSLARKAYTSHTSIQIKQTNPAKLQRSQQSHVYKGLLPIQRVLSPLGRAHEGNGFTASQSLSNMCPVTVQYTCWFLRTLLNNLESLLSRSKVQQEASPPWALPQTWKKAEQPLVFWTAVDYAGAETPTAAIVSRIVDWTNDHSGKNTELDSSKDKSWQQREPEANLNWETRVVPQFQCNQLQQQSK